MTTEEKRMEEIDQICDVLLEKMESNEAEMRYQEKLLRRAALKIKELNDINCELQEQINELHQEFLELRKSTSKRAS